MNTEKSYQPGLRYIPRGVWVLGFVSMFMDVSSEMIHSLLPLFMVGTLGASVLIVGVIDGIAESVTLIVKVFSGTLSDYLRQRKSITLLGYGLAALSKPLFALAPTTAMILAARLMDRVGKGIRGAPRDALIADMVPATGRGAAFGLRQALDTVGAFLGPSLAALLMILWNDDFRAVFWVALLPAVVCVLLLMFGLSEPVQNNPPVKTNPISKENLHRMSSNYWWIVAIGTVLTLARFSDAFLVLRAQQTGVPLALVPLVMVMMNVVYAAAAYPFGKLADQISRFSLIAWGIIALIAADVILAASSHWSGVLFGVTFWGIHLAMTQGLLAAMVADHAPADLRGTAYGIFNLISGIAMLLSGTIAGLLWDSLGSASTFYSGAIFSTLALAALFKKRSEIF